MNDDTMRIASVGGEGGPTTRGEDPHGLQTVHERSCQGLSNTPERVCRQGYHFK
jgi:hypothetical protein